LTNNFGGFGTLGKIKKFQIQDSHNLEVMTKFPPHVAPLPNVVILKGNIFGHTTCPLRHTRRGWWNPPLPPRSQKPNKQMTKTTANKQIKDLLGLNRQ